MGNLQIKLLQLGQYCDCLQSWKKFQKQTQEKTQNNLILSENQSNLQKEIEKVFQLQQVDNGFDKQLKKMQDRLKKRKKLREQIIKQKQQERIQKQQLYYKQNLQKLKHQQQLQLQRIQKQRNLRKKRLQQEQQKQKAQQQRRKRLQWLKKRNLQQKLKANKRNKRLQNHNKSYSTNDQLVLNYKDKNQLKFNNQNQDQLSSVQYNNNLSQDDQNNISNSFNNIFDNDKTVSVKTPHSTNIQIDHINIQQKQISQIDIIDLQKLNPVAMTAQINQLVRRRQKEQPKQRVQSHTVILNDNKYLQKHIRNKKDKNVLKNKNILHFDQGQQGNQQDNYNKDIKIKQKKKNNTKYDQQLSQDNNNDYFLDKLDKDQYLNEIFN